MLWKTGKLGLSIDFFTFSHIQVGRILVVNSPENLFLSVPMEAEELFESILASLPRDFLLAKLYTSWILILERIPTVSASPTQKPDYTRDYFLNVTFRANLLNPDCPIKTPVIFRRFDFPHLLAKIRTSFLTSKIYSLEQPSIEGRKRDTPLKLTEERTPSLLIGTLQGDLSPPSAVVIRNFEIVDDHLLCGSITSQDASFLDFYSQSDRMEKFSITLYFPATLQKSSRIFKQHLQGKIQSILPSKISDSVIEIALLD